MYARDSVGPWCRAALLILVALVALRADASAQSPTPSGSTPAPAGSTPAPTTTPESGNGSSGDTEQPRRFFETVTVSTTLNPSSVRETPGTVSVIDDAEIARNLVENVADLVKFEPGVYIESNLTRVGLNGFNIRGIGGNRVQTRIDGVETSEQFDFGPFNVHQFTLDLDALKSAEILRSSGSSLYGSDALGGVVSFFTKDPADYLAGRRAYAGGKTTFDGRSGDRSINAALAGGTPRLQVSLFTSFASGHEPHNRGTVKTEDATRTALNPQDRRDAQVLGKLVTRLGDGNQLRVAVEHGDYNVDTQAYTSRSLTVQGPITTNVANVTSVDDARRTRVSVDHELVNRAGLNQWSWNVFVQRSRTEQVVDERRITSGAGPTSTVARSGTLDYSQNTAGGAVQGRKAIAPGGHGVLLTFGGSYKRDTFDMLRDRIDIDAATGAVIPTTSLILPTKYFPKSEVGETGAYLQGEMRFGRLTLVPGLRYDRFTLDADGSDAVFLASLSPAPADFKADATSARLGASVRVTNALTVFAQYAGGFRAPPYSAVNSGFTNLLGGYTSVPNTELRPETSDNVDFGFRAVAGRASLGVTGFVSNYDDFIQQVARGTNPTTRLLEYQYQNVSRVRIHGAEFRGDVQLAAPLRLRAAYAVIRGNDLSGATKVPLNTIAPDQATLGLQYTPSAGKWGSDLTVRAVRGQSAAVAGSGMFAPDGYAVVDLLGWTSLGHGLTLRGGALNLTNTKYFEWTNVRGRSSTDPVIDRYSSPGISGVVSLGYRW
jgi:hemoglobin/transferrin/lactoferrin receptor protein